MTTKSTALHLAVEGGNLRAIQLLLQAGAQVNLYDGSLSTPLHLAAYVGHEEVGKKERKKNAKMMEYSLVQ